MNQSNKDMTREKLEIRINDAADGLLTHAEREELEAQLAGYPDLLMIYHDIMALPDFSGIYGSTKAWQSSGSIRNIRELLVEEDTFSTATVFWFKKYALAASVLILGVSSLAGFLSGAFDETGFDEAITADELLYPSGESAAEEYVSYFYDWADENDE